MPRANLFKFSALKNCGKALFCIFIVTLQPCMVAAQDGEYKEVKWVDLIPIDDLAALLNPPKELDLIADGSIEDSLDNKVESASNSRYFEVLKSQRIVEEYDGKKIRIPGFIVPIESDEEQRITSFFLVPYFGACLHLPPPPPNQIIYAKYPKGFQVDMLYDPFIIEGTVATEVVYTMVGTSAYTMQVDQIKAYEE